MPSSLVHKHDKLRNILIESPFDTFQALWIDNYLQNNNILPSGI